MNEYTHYLVKNNYIYDSENINISEIYISFLPVIDDLQKKFKKQLHDSFSDMYNTMDLQIFNLNDRDKEIQLGDIFSGTMKKVLNNIVTNDSNIFQSLLYKVLLFKLSLVD